MGLDLSLVSINEDYFPFLFLGQWNWNNLFCLFSVMIYSKLNRTENNRPTLSITWLETVIFHFIIIFMSINMKTLCQRFASWVLITLSGNLNTEFQKWIRRSNGESLGQRIRMLVLVLVCYHICAWTSHFKILSISLLCF